jgi:hypothetical protein
LRDSNKMENTKAKQRLQNTSGTVIIIIACVVFVLMISKVSPYAIDWHNTYFPAAQACFHGNTPYYQGSLLENPIWICILLAPFAIFPEAIGRGLFLIASIVAYYMAFQNVGMSKKLTLLIFLSPQVLYGLNTGTMDAFVLIAPILHPILGFMVSLLKPQIGIGYVLFLIVEWIWKKNYRMLFLALILSGAGIFISIWLGMPFSGRLIIAPWNTSLYPYSIPLGLALLGFGIKRHQKWESIVASPMLSPYLTFHSWVTVFMFKNSYYLAGMFSLSWVAYLIWHYLNL